MTAMKSAFPPSISVIPTVDTPDEPDDSYQQTRHFDRRTFSRKNIRQLALSPSAGGHYPLYDPNRLSPASPSSPALRMTPNTDGHVSKNESLAPPKSVDIQITPAPNPFNFQTQVISTSPVKPSVGQRRGHKYKHSSISAQHQIFQEPRPRAPLALPRDLPIPTLKETWKSMSRDQRHRLYWCICHGLIANLLFLSAQGSLTMTALSHLVYFDVGSALICVAVEVLGNFEVWRRSSIRYPFGLERAEVLAGFAMSVFLIFGGFDLVSHNVKHVLENQGGPAHEHEEPRVVMGTVDIVSVAAIIATLISAFGLKNHARISRVMRLSYLAILPSILSNPFHFLTLSVSTLLAILPLFSIRLNVISDSAICALIAISMFGLGIRLAIAQGLMLLMSYGGRISSASGKYKAFGVSDVLREIETEPSIERVEEAQFWQVHYGLCMANLKVSVTKGCDDATLSRLRLRVSNLIQNRLGEGYGRGGSLKWEVSLQMGTSTM
ncbi:cation efflux family-domain-containing protein [Xylaria nigripes]|nr:cation efflux family-domain-containing protein [Xylaria nigripes]